MLLSVCDIGKKPYEDSCSWNAQHAKATSQGVFLTSDTRLSRDCASLLRCTNRVHTHTKNGVGGHCVCVYACVTHHIYFAMEFNWTFYFVCMRGLLHGSEAELLTKQIMMLTDCCLHHTKLLLIDSEMRACFSHSAETVQCSYVLILWLFLF